MPGPVLCKVPQERGPASWSHSRPHPVSPALLMQSSQRSPKSPQSGVCKPVKVKDPAAAQSLTKRRGPKCRLTQRFDVPSMTGLLFRHFPFNAISISTGYRAPTVALVRCLPRSCWGGAARAVTVLSMSPPPNSGWHGYCTKIIRVCCPIPGTMRKQTERFHRFPFMSAPTCVHTPPPPPPRSSNSSPQRSSEPLINFIHTEANYLKAMAVLGLPEILACRTCKSLESPGLPPPHFELEFQHYV